MIELRVLVGAADFDVSTVFYADVLGLRVVEHSDDSDGRGTPPGAARGLPPAFYTAVATIVEGKS